MPDLYAKKTLPTDKYNKQNPPKNLDEWIELHEGAGKVVEEEPPPKKDLWEAPKSREDSEIRKKALENYLSESWERGEEKGESERMAEWEAFMERRERIKYLMQDIGEFRARRMHEDPTVEQQVQYEGWVKELNDLGHTIKADEVPTEGYE